MRLSGCSRAGGCADPTLPSPRCVQLERRRALNEAVCTELRSRILALWERLQIPQEQRDSSAMHLAGSRARTRRAVRPCCAHGGRAGAAAPGALVLLAARWRGEGSGANCAFVEGGAGGWRGSCLLLESGSRRR